jgi:hypothetical protein
MPRNRHGSPSLSSPPTTMNQSLMSSQKRVLYSECYINLNQYALQKRGEIYNNDTGRKWNEYTNTSYPVQTPVLPKARAYCHLIKPRSVANSRPARTVRLIANSSSYKHLLVKGSWNLWFLFHWSVPKKEDLILNKIETCHGAVMILAH